MAGETRNLLGHDTGVPWLYVVDHRDIGDAKVLRGVQSLASLQEIQAGKTFFILNWQSTIGSFRVKSTKILRIGPGHLSDLAKINF